MRFKICVFDAYGTLFDVAAAARAAAEEDHQGLLKQHWPALAGLWRQKQLEYTWLRAAGGIYKDFWLITQDALDFALESLGLENTNLRARLLELYFKLEAYPDVRPMLETLKEQGVKRAILSNGTPSMLGAAVDHAGLQAFFDGVLSVESLGTFKPDRRVYALVEEHFGLPSKDVLFISSNGWDASFAAAFGFTVAWVNRNNEPVDRLSYKPPHLLKDLEKIPNLCRAG